ncbi:MAG TPA: sulfite exporter TauE/SafE family protein [Patescibacteria group bacterium]|nr:sulfite exporter TauE/SafE family protein [Patescibacteria group bacterium]
MTSDLALFIFAGFVAQLIDGSLGMAYGVTASSLLLGMGLPPVVVSSTVHAAECFSTGASAASHHIFGNVRKKLFKQLVVPGVCGAVIGAYILTQLDGEILKPYIASYLLLMGVVIIFKAFKKIPQREVSKHITPLGFFGALIDTIGGGGWGPIVASNLVARGNDVRNTIGSVNAAEFFVTLAASLTFLLTVGFSHPEVIVGLAIGGVMAAPIAAYLTKRIPVKPFMITVGVLVIALSLRTIWKVWG